MAAANENNPAAFILPKQPDESLNEFEMRLGAAAQSGLMILPRGGDHEQTSMSMDRPQDYEERLIAASTAPPKKKARHHDACVRICERSSRCAPPS
jgi:hypothetical protein